MSRQLDRPEPGFYTLRLVKNGPRVAARIARLCTCTIGGGEHAPHDWTPACDRPWPVWLAEINGDQVSEPDRDPLKAGVFRIWESGEPCTADEYRYRLELKAWAEREAPDAPEANPRKPIDLNQLPPLF